MSYILKNGFRKNRYFDEEKYFDENIFKPLGFRKGEGKGVSINTEGRIDEFISRGNLYYLNGGSYSVEGYGIIDYNIEGNEQVEINYRGNTAVIERYFIKENSNVKIESILNGDFVYVKREFHIKENSSVEIHSGIISNKFSELINIINMRGDNSKAYDRSGIVSKKGESRVYSQLNHIGKNTEGDSYTKAVLRENAKSSIEGMIKIHKGGVKTNSYLNQHALLFEDAEAYAFPALEIENNDVRASHSASVSEINEEDLFYLMNRGIDKKEAERMIIEGFLSDSFGKNIITSII